MPCDSGHWPRVDLIVGTASLSSPTPPLARRRKRVYTDRDFDFTLNLADSLVGSLPNGGKLITGMDAVYGVTDGIANYKG